MSTTPAEAARASGYLVMFAPPALLVASVTGDAPWIAFVGLIVVLPFLRAVVDFELPAAGAYALTRDLAPAAGCRTEIEHARTGL